MTGFIRVALRKVNDLLKRENFVKVAFMSAENVRLEYTDRMCVVSNFGNVRWYGLG